jgi:hypothetical protein
MRTTLAIILAIATALPAMASTTAISLTGSGPSSSGVMTNVAIAAPFTINYQPLGAGAYTDNVFPDYDRYTFSMNLAGGLTDYQSRGAAFYFDGSGGGGNWDSSAGSGTQPWQTGGYAGQTYLPTGSASSYGVVRTDAYWTITYAYTESGALFQHTILAGTVLDFVYGGPTGISTADLIVYDTAYRGYGTSPGLDTYAGRAYQGFDSSQEPSGNLAMGEYLFTWDGAAGTGTLTPIPEPATILVWSLLGAASWLGMRVWRQGTRVGRQPWSPENRQAILEIVSRGESH